MTGTKSLADDVVEFVGSRDWVTFVELENFLKPRMEVKGEWSMLVPGYENVVLWVNMSEEFIDMVSFLLKAKRLFAYPTDALCYMIDGGMLQLPYAKKPPKGGYKKPHWAPVCFRTVPHSDKAKRAEARAKRKPAVR